MQIQIPSAADGEVYLGSFIDRNGDVTHTYLLPGENDRASWREQMDWAKSVGADLPTRAELLMAYERHRDLFEQAAYWSNQPDTDPGYSGWAWCQYFYDGNQDFSHQGLELRARAVRRLSI
ncbi:DUF1566 domain-containing protein [Burkholderia arboris]|uniref:DUF1566 domain-containing protein n=1 Tax=Burkholderia arboris TaxID=488730 RepID=A0ABZ3DPC7_9BURK